MAALRPLTVSDHNMEVAWENLHTPAVVGTDMIKGELCVLSSGLLAAPAEGSATLSDGQYIAFVTTQKYTAAQRTDGSVPLQQTKVAAIPLLPEMLLEANYYYDGGGVNDVPTEAMIGGTYCIKRITVTAYGSVLVLDGATSTSGKLTATIVALVDDPGTVYGRVKIRITSGFRLFT